MFIFPNGEILRSIISDSVKEFQHLLIHESFSFDIIFAACRIASSSLLNSNGLTPASTSSASRPAVPGTPKHIARPFLCIFSRGEQLPICQTGAAYSICGTTNALYSCNIQLGFMTSVSLTLLNESNDRVAFLSTFSICFSNLSFSSNVIIPLVRSI